MEETKENPNIDNDNITNIDSKDDGNPGKSSNSVSNSDINNDNNNSQKDDENTDKIPNTEKKNNENYKDENNNKTQNGFSNGEENPLSNLVSSLDKEIISPEDNKAEDESQNDKTEVEIEGETEVEGENGTEGETEVEGENGIEGETGKNELKDENEVTYVSVLTETDPSSFCFENEENGSELSNIFNGCSQILVNGSSENKHYRNDPTFQTELVNQKAAKRPTSSQLTKRASSNKSTSRTRKVIKYSSAKKNSQRPSTASDVRRSKCESFASDESSLPSEEELQNALDLMIKKQILPDAEIRPEVINYARKVGMKKMLEESYDDATQIDIAIDIMFTSIEDDRIREEEAMKKNVLQYRMDQTINKKIETQKKYVELINSQENRYKEKYDEALKRHELEIENLKNEWRNPDRVVEYSKPSSKLFQLRKQQKTLALLHDFQNAKQVKKIADQLEKEESEAALKRAKDAMKIEYQQLVERQQKELYCLRENHEKNLNTIKMSQVKDEELVQNTMNLLNLKMANKPAAKPKLLPPLPKQRCTTARQSVPITGMITYRTRSQLNNFRKDSGKSKLPLSFDFVS